MKGYSVEIEEIINEQDELRFQTYIYNINNDDYVDLYSANNYDDGFNYFINWLKINVLK